jgi:SOS response regulatory protein OraA/RecX
MKTKVTMHSGDDRNLFGVVIRQSTGEGFLSITDLQQAYEKARWMHGWGERRINHVLNTEEVKERVYELLLERNLIKMTSKEFMSLVETEGIVKALKGLKLWKTTGRGANKSVMADPYIWTLIAMELNPVVYAKVVIWLTDSLIFDRMEAGNRFLPMNSAIARIIAKPDYPKYARELNVKVFGHHMSGMRNIASSKELREIAEIEKAVTKAIEKGWINDEESLLDLIRTY